MMMADEGFDLFGQGEDGSFDDADDDGGDLSMDLDTFWHILGEVPETMDQQQQQQSTPEDLSVKNVTQGESALDHASYGDLHLQNEFTVLQGLSSSGTESSSNSLFKPAQNSEALDLKMGYCGGLFESAESSVLVSDYGKPESSSQICSPVQTYSGKHESWLPLLPCREAYHSERFEASQVDIPRCSTSSNLAEQGDNHASDFIDKTDTLDIHSKHVSHSPVMGTLDMNFGIYGASSENSMDTLEPENNSGTSLDFSVMDAYMSSQYATSTETTRCQGSDAYSEWNDHHPMQHCLNAYGLVADNSLQYIPNSFYPQGLTSDKEFMTKMKDETEDFLPESACSSSKMLYSEGGRSGGHTLEVPKTDYLYINGHSYSCEDGNYVSPVSGNSYSNADGRSMADIASSQPLTSIQSCMSMENQSGRVKDEHSNDSCYSLGVVDEAVTKKSPYGRDRKVIIDKNFKQSVPSIWHPMSMPQLGLHALDKKEDTNLVSKRPLHAIDGIGGEYFNEGNRVLNLKAPMRGLPFTKPSTSNKQLLGGVKDEKDVKLIQPKTMSSNHSKLSYGHSKLSSESIWSSSSNCRPILDNDPDICIIEEFSQPARSHHSLVPAKSVVTSQHSTYDGSLHHTGVGGTRFRANDESSIFQAALQDLSQPRSELSPPDGLLAVPLLRHQRIALSWMVNKETAGTHCSGGILADDQGLGKTISTIALILKERPPSSRPSQDAMKQGQPETLNLDEDEDEVTEEHAYSVKPVSDESTPKSLESFMHAKGRPAAGTLVVCPTSVLRQWADELHNKVTEKANISVLVYHGSSRTKDPCELAKYDVVLTTYSIVSMEVPKQPLANQDNDDDEKGNLEANVDRPMGFSSNRKRKYPPSSERKSSKNKKGTDNAPLESVSHPLAKVRWFRVVLDEAQSIKNHKTQVARACWGLRAKRRWCLSGTPIQNAIDDLYSYFRFLRYDPYSSYQEFCSKIKGPISRNSSKGYKKLQAVLKTIMLRRTKGTLLDGKPIINLPSKSVELKKVEFSKEERDFYTRLEADSRAQFEEYAAAGTVKQNYVNILLMLLRLRQACDHPLLVKGCDSKSVWRSSVESASRLPQERRSSLLNRVEDSMALCGICSEPPEDAVVTICGHVFCNQCILEHLTRDDNHCPAINCKDPLSVSSVFSRHTLSGSLSNQSCIERSSSSCSELVEAAEPCGEDSSKIRAALEVLRPLSIPQDGTTLSTSRMISSDRTDSSPQNSLNPHDVVFCTDITEKKNLVLDTCVKKPTNTAGEKAIVFSQWTKMLDLLEASLKSSSIQYRRLDGTMSIAARDKAVKDFNNLPEVTVMIMSLKAASLGLNMVAACHVLLLDLWWNPTTEDQAIDRAHRIGQTRPVTVLRLTVKDTVEDRILALQQKKREMVASAFGEDENGGGQTRLTVEDLKYLFTA